MRPSGASIAAVGVIALSGMLGTVAITAMTLTRADASPPAPRVIRVGPREAITRIEDAARVAQDGDVVEIEAAEYPTGIASWSQNGLTIRGVGGRPRMLAAGRSAEEKAIWVVKGSNVTIEQIQFAGARVTDENGAGIRHEGPGRLVIRDCRFTGNEIGLMSTNSRAELVVERSEFDSNAVAGGQRSRTSVGHQIYVGRIARFVLRDSYVHHGRYGHLVKSRARENFLIDNRITDEAQGRASYEIEFPDGGVAYVVGNFVQQSAQTENRVLIAFGAESTHWPKNELHLANNTLLDDTLIGGVFVRVFRKAQVSSVNNVLVGNGIAVIGAKLDPDTIIRARRAPH